MINLTELAKMAAKKGVTILMYFDKYGHPCLRLERGIWRIENMIPVNDYVLRDYDQGREMEAFVERMLFNLDMGIEREFNREENKIEGNWKQGD